MDGLIATIICICAIVPFIVFKLYGMVAFILAFSGILGGFEAAGALAKSGHPTLGLWVGIPLSIGGLTGGWILWINKHLIGTISQQFWKFAELHPIWAVVLALLFPLLGIGLALHLLWKQIKKKES